MGLAFPHDQIERKTYGIISHKPAYRTGSIYAFHKYTHKKQASKTASENPQESLKLIVDIADIGVGKPKRHRTAQKAYKNRRNFSAKKQFFVSVWNIATQTKPLVEILGDRTCRRIEV